MYYKLTIEQVTLIGEFEYLPNQKFNPFMNDGYNNYYIDSRIYELLKEHSKFKNINFDTIEKVESIDFKKIELQFDKNIKTSI